MSVGPRLAGGQTLDDLLAEAVETAMAEDGWAPLANVGSELYKLASDFDPRIWGHTRLSDLVKAHPRYEVIARSPGEGKQRVAFARRKATAQRKTGSTAT